MDYTVKYSSRKTLAISIKDGCVIVRAPRGCPKIEIEKQLSLHMDWIEKHIAKSIRRIKKDEGLTDRDISRLKREARLYFKSKLLEYSRIMGLTPGRMTITSAKHRYGSCSSSGNICFSYRLMLYPEAAREYVVVHELAHLVEMNHSPRFYNIIKKYMPDYKERKKLLD